MTDEVDAAQSYFELAETAQRAAIAQSLKGKKPAPTGRCHNCDTPLPLPKLYCDPACAEDHEWYQRRAPLLR